MQGSRGFLPAKASENQHFRHLTVIFCILLFAIVYNRLWEFLWEPITMKRNQLSV